MKSKLIGLWVLLMEAKQVFKLKKFWNIISAVALMLSTLGFAIIPIKFDKKIDNLTSEYLESKEIIEKISSGRSSTVQRMSEAYNLKNLSLILTVTGDKAGADRVLKEAMSELEVAAYEIYSVLEDIQMEKDLVSKGHWAADPKYFEIYGQIIKMDDFGAAKKKLDDYRNMIWKELFQLKQSSHNYPFLLRYINKVKADKNLWWIIILVTQGFGLFSGVIGQLLRE